LFRSWLSLRPEKTLINQDNLYIYLLSGVLKLASPWFREPLIDAEKRALESTGVISREGPSFFEIPLYTVWWSVLIEVYFLVELT